MDQKLFETMKNDKDLLNMIRDLFKDQTLRKEEAYRMIADFLAAKEIPVTDDDIDVFLKNNKRAILEVRFPITN